MYFNFFDLLAIFLFYYSIFFFSFTKFLLKFFPGFLMISPYYQLLMVYSYLAICYTTILQLATQLIKGQIRKMLSSKSKYQSQRKKKGVATQLFPSNLFYFPDCSAQFRILSTFVQKKYFWSVLRLYKSGQYSELGRTIRKIKEIARKQLSRYSLFLLLPKA